MREIAKGDSKFFGRELVGGNRGRGVKADVLKRRAEKSMERSVDIPQETSPLVKKGKLTEKSPYTYLRKSDDGKVVTRRLITTPETDEQAGAK
ncbi:MAG: hypothetical protein AAB408_03855 [Patescibacteria group bacterium]|mgnify:CR=1 FL=1